MKYKEIRNLVEKIGNKNYEDFINAIVNFEKGIDDKDALDMICAEFMDSDTKELLHEDFDYMIDELKDNGEIKDIPFVKEEKDNLVNIVGNIIGEVEVLDREARDGKSFTAVNFAVAYKYKDGNGLIRNCFAYVNKAEIPMEFQKGDFLKLFEEVRTSIDNKGKEHSNVRMLSSKIFKAKEQMKNNEKGSDKSKDSVLDTIQKFKAEDKEKSNEAKNRINRTKDKITSVWSSDRTGVFFMDIRLLKLIVCRLIVLICICWGKLLNKEWTMDIKTIFAQNLKKYRTKMNLSQEELGFRSGLHRTYISDVEREVRSISLDNIQKVANALEIEIYLLFVKE